MPDITKLIFINRNFQKAIMNCSRLNRFRMKKQKQLHTFLKQHFYKQHQVKIGKKVAKSLATPETELR